MAADRFVIASLPGRGRANPYVDLFYNALLPHGIDLYSEPLIDLEWGSTHFQNIDAIHFHWPEYIWRQTPPSRPQSRLRRLLRAHVPGIWRVFDLVDRLGRLKVAGKMRKLRDRSLCLQNFRSFLRQAKQANVRVIWTLHNMESHENWDVVDGAGFRLLARVADLVICHSDDAKARFLKTHKPNGSVVVMPHGNYDGIYPAPRPREQILRELGLDPKLPVVGCVGALRTYKGFDLACQAIKSLGGKVQLLCAGAPHHHFPLHEFEQSIDSTPGAILVARQLTEQEFADYCAASDVILLPYRKITGSGALLAALTLERGVVASDLTFFREVLNGFPDAGILVKPENTAALAEGIKQYLAMDKKHRQTAARRLADSYDWSHVIAPVVTVINHWRSETPRYR